MLLHYVFFQDVGNSAVFSDSKYQREIRVLHALDSLTVHSINGRTIQSVAVDDKKKSLNTAFSQTAIQLLNFTPLNE